MINVVNKVLTAWYELLNGNISVPVYRVDAPPTEEGHYVILRAESSTPTLNNHKFVTNPVIITEVVTKFATRIDDSVANDIDNEISELLLPTASTHALPQQDDIQITSVIRQDQTYLPEDDGTFRYHTLITRNVHRVEQLQTQS